jgi:hypothetical protein
LFLVRLQLKPKHFIPFFQSLIKYQIRSEVLTMLSIPETQKRLSAEVADLCRVFYDYPKYEEHYKDFYFLWYNENLEIDKIDLESENHDDKFIGYVINGDLFTKRIVNFETDYGVHLFVLGNIVTDYMAVGGQDIYIKGNLQVKKLFVGSYNHGTTNISGNFYCPLVVTDDYSCVVDGSFEGENLAWGDPVCLFRSGSYTYPPYNESEFEDHFDDSFLNEYEGINFQIIAEAINNEEEIPKKYSMDTVRDTITPEKVRQILCSIFLNPMTGELKKTEQSGNLYIALKNHTIEELIIQETYQSYKYIIVENQVNIYFKGEKDNEFQVFVIGSNRYRKAKRLLDSCSDRVQYWR